MQFSELLKIHISSLAPGNHPDILGDGFLFHKNPVYRAVKSMATKGGASFTEATTQYLLMPFNQLDEIVRLKQIPYVPAARLMNELEAKHPGIFGLEQMPMPESYHLHEAAHVIADACCASVVAETISEKILRALLCESFANTVDALACGYADSDLHRLFIQQNSYMKPAAELSSCLARVRATRGAEFTFRLMLSSYVNANFLREPVSAEPGPLHDDILALHEMVQELDPLFRVTTTQNYFQLQGFPGEVYDLLDFGFAGLLLRSDFADAVTAMARALNVPIERQSDK